MMRNVCWARLAVLSVVWLVLTGHVHAQVKDDAGFFSPAAISQASEGIKEIKRSYNKDFQVETFRTVPPDKAAKFKTLGDAARKRFFADWAASRAKALNLQGVYLHICKQPGHLEVSIDDGTLKKALRDTDRDGVRALLLDAFRKMEFDKGLTGAVALVRARLEKNLGPATPRPVAKGIVDEGRFFSPTAVTKVSEEIKDFQKRLGKEILIETFTAPPADVRQQLDGTDAAGRSKVFAAWMGQRAAANRIDGVRVLICKEPPHIRAGVAEGLLSREFTTANRDELVRTLVTGFKAKEYDQALTAAVDFIYDTVDKNTAKPLPPPLLGAVMDAAGFFSPPAQEKATQGVKNIKTALDLDLSVETFARVPPGKLRQASAVTPEARVQFFRDWAKERAQQAGARGVWVLICKQPAHVQISIAADAVKKGIFNTADRDGMREVLAAGLSGKQADRGLLGAMSFFDETLRALPVKDEAGYFNAESVAEANQRIKAMRRKYHKDVLIETVATLPADKKEAYAKISPDDGKGRDQFFAEWQTQRAQTRNRGDSKVDGVEVLICKEPPRIQIGVTPDALKHFGTADRDALRDLLVTRFKESAADKGLIESVTFVADTLPALTIKDDGGFFTGAGIDKGNAAIRDIRRRFHKDVLIETFAAVPAERANGVDLTDKASRRKLFSAWAEERQKAAGVDGISLLICKSPMSLQVATGPETGARFPADSRDKAVQLLIRRFNEKNFDGGLTDALALVAETLQKNRVVEVKGGGPSGHSFADLGEDKVKKEAVIVRKEEAKKETVITDKEEAKKEPVAAVAQTKDGPGMAGRIESAKHFVETKVGENNMLWIVVYVVLGLLGLWIFIGLLRAIFGRRPSYPPPQQPVYSGGRPPAGAPTPQYGSGVPMARPVGQAPNPYYGSGQYYGQPPPSGGGSFMHGLLGGMLGGVAGSWLYGRFAGGGGSASAGWSGSTSRPVAGPAPGQAAPTPAAPAAGTGYSSSGGDFGDTPEAGPKYASSGGDFGEEQPPRPAGYASSGGDFGEAPASEPASSGGDFGGTAEPASDASSGGDFGGAQEAATEGSGGDFGGEQQAEPVSESGGGDFGGGDAGGGNVDSGGGGDFGGGNVDTGGGGDFGGGNVDTGGGGGGDFGGGNVDTGGGAGGGGDFG